MIILKNTDNKFSKREKIITLIAGLLIISLSAVVVFQYFAIVRTQREINSFIETQSSVSNDGKIVWINPETTVSVQSIESVNSELSETIDNLSEKREYVINKNSRKIHSPECDSAKKTLEKNKETVEWSEEEYFKALEDGYTPCSICKAGR
ncbi:MAG: hypothetical protein E7515_01215 [Ruminococcaceae bacterium]|nr:hypothetical protein [Oscillospiraceae bacterium]